MMFIVRGRLVRDATIAAIAASLTACGGNGLDASDRTAIRAALARWAAASTPAQACAVMSSGFRFFVGRGNYFSCAKDLGKTLGPLVPQRATVRRIEDRGGQVAVYATVVGRGPHASTVEHQGAETFWFVWQRGAWRLNSVGYRVGLGPPPPGAPGTPPLKR
jgi:hypothetical protein